MLRFKIVKFSLSSGRGEFLKDVTQCLKPRKHDAITVYASDDLSHGPEDIFSREETLATLGRVSLELARVGLPVLPSLGNHDIIPKNQVTLSIAPTLVSW